MRILLLLLLAFQASAATYYVDFDGGNDASAGTATGTAWKSIPGTRNAADSADLSASYGGGTFSTSAKVPAGTIFMLKRGTTWDSTDGGIVSIRSDWYDNASSGSPTVIRVDSTWGSGSTTIDGTGITATTGLMLIQRDGIQIDGAFTDGLVVQDSANSGIYFKEQAGTSAALNDVSAAYCKLFNNSTSPSDDAGGQGNGQITMTRADGVVIENCNIDGDNNWSQGLRLGESTYAVVDAICRNLEIKNLQGNDDCGIGAIAWQGQIQFTNIVSHHNYKGFDLGEVNGGGVAITYTVINSTVYSNSYGINFNSAEGAYAGAVNFYAINNLVFDQVVSGIYCYAGPFTLHVVHNTLWNNGTGSAFTSCNLSIEQFDEQDADGYVFNNIFYKPAGDQNFYNHYFDQDVARDNLSLYFDYNSWVQAAAEQFAQWAGSEGAPDNTQYTYGANGPGHASGNWWAWYSGSTTPPANGRLGHFHADPHSVGTGADNTTSPSFTDYASDVVTLTATYPGTNLTARAWYIAPMSKDRAGNNRVEWSMGAYEFAPASATSSSSRPGNRGQSKRR